jgi:CheY-like chemotaxis protein
VAEKAIRDVIPCQDRTPPLGAQFSQAILVTTRYLGMAYLKASACLNLPTGQRMLSPRPASRVLKLPDRAIISIVDDDDSVRVATSKLLKLYGFIVHAFASAEEFLGSKYLDETRCLIADVRMPGMSGIELQEKLKQQGYSTPMIFITAFPRERAGPCNGWQCCLFLDEALRRQDSDRVHRSGLELKPIATLERLFVKRVNSARRNKRKQKMQSSPKMFHVEFLPTPANMPDDVSA